MTVSLTRLVHFGRVPVDLQRRHRDVCAVAVAFNWNTRVGTPIREVYKRGVAAYATPGYPGEWKLHHQGGPGGSGRVLKAPAGCPAFRRFMAQTV
jgi:hypothetical protein